MNMLITITIEGMNDGTEFAIYFGVYSGKGGGESENFSRN
jgi:hypothetical protein